MYTHIKWAMKKRDVFQEQTLADSSSSLPRVQRKRVPSQERAFPMGNLIGINAYHIDRALLEQRLTGGGYGIHETPHFLVCLHVMAPILVVHWFAPAEIDADLGRYLLQELKPLGILEQPQNFGDIFGAIVGSLFPRDSQRAWHLYGTNTLQRYRHLLAMESEPPLSDSPIGVFSTLYRRVCELVVGEHLLDAGCSFGFLPLVVAEHMPSLTKVVGVDIQADPFPVTTAIAAERHLTNIQFTQADLLAAEIRSIGRFDTVTVLHVLEHFREADMYRVLTNLLEVTEQRLIVAVPYEPGEPEAAYGHEQLFSRARLEAVGQWCLEQVGCGQMTCEDCAGGLLVIDRYSY